MTSPQKATETFIWPKMRDQHGPTQKIVTSYSRTRAGFRRKPDESAGLHRDKRILFRRKAPEAGW